MKATVSGACVRVVRVLNEHVSCACASGDWSCITPVVVGIAANTTIVVTVKVEDLQQVVALQEIQLAEVVRDHLNDVTVANGMIQWV